MNSTKVFHNFHLEGNFELLIIVFTNKNGKKLYEYLDEHLVGLSDHTAVVIQIVRV